MNFKKQSGVKTYFIFICFLFSIVTFIKFSHTIFPFMSDDEYFIDKYGKIHDNNCPYRDVPWFTRKYNKYDILIKDDQEICKECLLLEENKLMMLHKFNLKDFILSLRRNGAPEEYIANEIKEYK